MNTKHSVLAGVCLLVAAFVAGLGVGRANRDKPRPPETARVTNPGRADFNEALAACEDEMEALSQPSPNASTTDAMSDEAKQAVAEKAATVEVLENELRGCRKSDLLLDAELCTASDRYSFALLLPVLHADQKCSDKLGVGDLIIRHSEQCLNFEDDRDVEELDMGTFSDTEVADLYHARHYGRNREFSANMARGIEKMIRDCHQKFGLPDE